MSGLDQLFPGSYEASRQRFRNNFALIQEMWPDARLESHTLTGEDDLSIDWALADALERREKLLVFTSGQHGIEGFIGAGVLQLFLEQFLPHLNPKRTGVLLVHCITPRMSISTGILFGGLAAARQMPILLKNFPTSPMNASANS